MEQTTCLTFLILNTVKKPPSSSRSPDSAAIHRIPKEECCSFHIRSITYPSVINSSCHVPSTASYRVHFSLHSNQTKTHPIPWYLLKSNPEKTSKSANKSSDNPQTFTELEKKNCMFDELVGWLVVDFWHLRPTVHSEVHHIIPDTNLTIAI